MGYKIQFKSSAEKELAKLDKPIQRRIAGFIEELKTLDNPRVYGIAMQGNSRRWRYRIGDYRMIAEINDNTITIIIFKIGHRGEVYR